METRRNRNPEQTRSRLLEAAFKEIYESGFQAASIDRILSNTQVTKGALYHHFPNKHALGIAVIEEMIEKQFHESMQVPLEETDDPIATLNHIINQQSATCCVETLTLGCPLNNLIQEMSPLDETFRDRLNQILRRWGEAIAGALRRGQANGRIRQDVNPDEAAAFIMAALEGVQGMAKATRSPESLRSCLKQLQFYLGCLSAA